MNKERAIFILNLLIDERRKYFERIKHHDVAAELRDLKEYIERKLE